MDKYEYKVRSEEIKDLIGKKKYTEAMKIADTIDWRRVKNVNMLCTISDLYKLNRRYEESREILLLAYERHPGGRMIIYSLCELSIKLDDVVQAVEYYKEFVQTAPRDNGRYVLQYKLYEAQEVTLEERIAVLEELKRREYREKWAYELAYLYHRIGLSTKCVEECDELILWFGEGKYVTKAMELKMLHAPLSEEQQKKYKKAKGTAAPVFPAAREEDDELDIQVKPVNVGEYATINLQKELAESMKEVLGEEDVSGGAQPTIEYEAVGSDSQTDEIRNFEADMETDDLEAFEEEEEPAEQEKPVQPDQAERPAAAKLPAEPEKEEEPYLDGPGDFTREILSNLLQDTGEIREIRLPEEENSENKTPPDGVLPEEKTAEEAEKEIPDAEEIFFEDGDTSELPAAAEKEEEPKVVKLTNTGKIPKIVQHINPTVSIPSAESMAREKNENFDSLLSQEYDGQIRLAVPEKDTVEKQITGQMSIEDILLEWEKMKKENEEKRAEAVRKRVKEQTGEIFSQFDASMKQGILAELDVMAEDSIREEKKKSPETEKTDDQAARKTEQEAAGAEMAIQGVEAAETAPKEAAVKEAAETEKAALSDAAESAESAEEKKEASAGKENTADEKNGAEEKPQRLMTTEEKKLFGPFIQTKSTRNQILNTLDNISLASYTGNVILTGEPGMDSIKLAKNIIKEIQMTDSNFSGRMAKITGQALNHKDMEKTFARLSNGALIVEGAGDLKEAAVKSMTKLLEQEKQGIIVILEDTKININKLLDNYKALHQNFNLRIDVEALDNDSLVLFAKKYALEREYAIDELGVLALYTRIAELQTSEHSVTTKEVKEIVEEAIYHADRKNVTHFMDILFGKRYDEEDMIILREKDFV